MKIFLVCPVRDVTLEYKEKMTAQVSFLESQSHAVHYPPRDTNQNDRTGLGICKENLKAIQEADVVYFAWDGQSQGCLFDLGMAFALKKQVVSIVGYIPSKTKGKSFQNMVFDWEDQGKEQWCKDKVLKL